MSEKNKCALPSGALERHFGPICAPLALFSVGHLKVRLDTLDVMVRPKLATSCMSTKLVTTIVRSHSKTVNKRGQIWCGSAGNLYATFGYIPKRPAFFKKKFFSVFLNKEQTKKYYNI